MSVIEESGIPLEAHLNHFKEMLNLAEKGDNFISKEATQSRIKELEELIEQQKSEEKKLEWKCIKNNWEWCAYAKNDNYYFYIRVFPKIDYSETTPTSSNVFVLTLYSYEHPGKGFEYKTLEEAKIKAEDIAKVMELL